MKNKGLLPSILISILAFGLTACPHNSGKKKQGAGIKRVKGDPNIFVKNSALNGNLALPFAISTASQNWELDASGYQEGSAEVDVNQIIKEQTPQESSGAQNSPPLTTRLSGTQTFIEGRYKNLPAKFTFNRSGNGWILYRYEALNQNVVLGSPNSDAVIHTSWLNDHSAFSLLLQDKTVGKRSVVSLTFVQVKSKVTRLGDKAFEYMMGKGQKIGWRKDVPRRILICGQLPATLPQIVQESVAVWSKALEHRLQLSAVAQTSCPPFSDLNTQTFAFTTDWIEIAGEPGVEAQTFSVVGPGREFIIDGDIFYMLGEHQESMNAKGIRESVMNPAVLAQPKMQKSLRHTSIHELGHFLGLHHQFNPQIDSVMSYNENLEAKLYDYDIKAIRHLYDGEGSNDSVVF